MKERMQALAAAMCSPRIDRIMNIAAIALFVLTAMSLDSISFADSSAQIIDSVTKGMGDIYKIIIGIVLPVGAIVFAWNLFKAFFGGERGMEQAKRNILIIIIVIMCVLTAPVIINAVGGWFSGNTSWTFDAPQ